LLQLLSFKAWVSRCEPDGTIICRDQEKGKNMKDRSIDVTRAEPPRNKKPKDKAPMNRRSFLKTGLVAGGGAAAAGLLPDSAQAAGGLTPKDAALLRFPAALEILEADFWIQYNELAGVQDAEVPGGTGNPDFTEALEVLDEDMAIYVHDNTDDEIT